MLQLVLAGDESSFEQLIGHIDKTVKYSVLPFTRNREFARLEDEESLHNVGLLKAYDAFRNFKYDNRLSEEHNERRFLAQVKTYIRHHLIDMLSAASAKKRGDGKSAIAMHSLSDEYRQFGGGEGPIGFDVPSNMPPPDSQAIANELEGLITNQLEDDENEMFQLMLNDYTSEQIAGRMGCPTSSVRKVSAKASRYASNII